MSTLMAGFRSRLIGALSFLGFKKTPTTPEKAGKSNRYEIAPDTPPQVPEGGVPKSREAQIATAEVYVTQFLNRTEFRQLCDQQKTYDAILKSLK